MIDACNPQVMRSLLAEYGFHFSKSKGQNFLTQPWVPERIVADSGIDASCGVVEIGPGFGALTQALCRCAGKVVALELDGSLRPVLSRTVGCFDNLELRFCDALKADFPALIRECLDGLRPVACANLPYYITSPVLTALLQDRCFASVTVMVQKEVAQRICAAPGSRDYSAFTVFCNYYAKPRLLFDVPASCFVPQPKVTSAVLRLDTLSQPPIPVADEALFFRTVRASFAQRRKTLCNALSAGFREWSKTELAQALERCGIAPGVRGETLGLAQFAAIADEIRREG